MIYPSTVLQVGLYDQPDKNIKNILKILRFFLDFYKYPCIIVIIKFNLKIKGEKNESCNQN
jgi:hypothetical protein